MLLITSRNLQISSRIHYLPSPLSEARAIYTCHYQQQSDCWEDNQFTYLLLFSLRSALASPPGLPFRLHLLHLMLLVLIQRYKIVRSPSTSLRSSHFLLWFNTGNSFQSPQSHQRLSLSLTHYSANIAMCRFLIHPSFFPRLLLTLWYRKHKNLYSVFQADFLLLFLLGCCVFCSFTSFDFFFFHSFDACARLSSSSSSIVRVSIWKRHSSCHNSRTICWINFSVSATIAYIKCIAIYILSPLRLSDCKAYE